MWNTHLRFEDRELGTCSALQIPHLTMRLDSSHGTNVVGMFAALETHTLDSDKLLPNALTRLRQPSDTLGARIAHG